MGTKMSDLCILNHINETFIFANTNDNFIKTLPDSADIFGFPSKEISHSHLLFFEKLIQLFNNEIIFIDVGAYLGTISLLLAKHMQKNNINCPFYLFEPNDKNLNCIKKSIDFNNINNILLSPKAVSNFVGKSGFSIRDENHVAGRLSNKKNDQMVETTTLDNEIKTNSKRNIIVKIDTEGNEPNVLKGMIELIDNNNCVLILELHPFCLNNKITSQEDMGQFLKNRFDLFTVENIGYPKNIQRCENPDLAEYCTRGGVTDLICLPRGITVNY